jgi:cytochrome c peroxidase
MRVKAGTSIKTCPKTTIQPKNSQCCVWYQIQHDLLTTVFQRGCRDNARASIRLAFHDAAAFSFSLQRQGKYPGGGTDGSIIKFPEELARPENSFLSNIVDLLKPIADKYGVSYGDIIQYSAAVALTVCPGGPQVAFYAGRPDATRMTPTGLLPSTKHNPATLIARFKDMGLQPWEMIALTGAHTVAGAGAVNDTDPGQPFDRTERTWDTQFYVDTLQHNVPRGTVQINSDRALARDPSTACTFQHYVGNQKAFNADFTASMFKMSLIGHPAEHLAHFVDCSEAVPAPKPLRGQVRFPALKNWDLSCKAPNGLLVEPSIPRGRPF